MIVKMLKRKVFELISRHPLIKRHDLIRNNEGMAAVEFAMLVPFMIALYMGTVEFGQAMSIDRKLTSVVSASADLIAQSQEITSAEIDDIFKISKAIIAPYSDTTLKIRLSSVLADATNVQAVTWSFGSGSAPHSIGAQIPGMPASITEANTSVVVAEVEYTYTSPVSYYIVGPVTMKETFYIRPRTSMQVVLK